MPTTSNQDIPTEGAHVRLDTDPRDIGVPVTMVREGGRMIVEGTAISDDRMIVAARPVGEETTFRLRRGDVRMIEN